MMLRGDLARYVDSLYKRDLSSHFKRLAKRSHCSGEVGGKVNCHLRLPNSLLTALELRLYRLLFTEENTYLSRLDEYSFSDE